MFWCLLADSLRCLLVLLVVCALEGRAGVGHVRLVRERSGIVGCDSGSDFYSGIVGVGGIVQWRIVGKDGRIVGVTEVAGNKVVVYCSSAPGRHTIPFLKKRYRVASSH